MLSKAWNETEPTVVSEVTRRAIFDSADYADTKMPECLSFRDRFLLHKHAFNKRANGTIVEFGVFRGESITHFAGLTKERICGFDSLIGLREELKGWSLLVGDFDLGGVLPPVPSNVTLIKGWFNETLPGFLKDHPEPFGFVHIDGDTYEAAKAVFDTAGDKFQKGTIIVFDEYFGYRGWRLGEYKAWQEFVKSRGLTYEYIAFSVNAVSVVIT